jgi:hypothetical protein
MQLGVWQAAALQTCRDAFAKYDTNGDGVLSPDEIHGCLFDMGFLQEGDRQREEYVKQKLETLAFHDADQDGVKLAGDCSGVRGPMTQVS